MTLISGTRLGPYEIHAPLGAGGMGEVYRAHDTRLGRDVALKILPASLARDPERLRRFEQESRAVAALNHPNILAIYDVGQSDGSPYLVTELLEGESLREVLDRGPLAQRKVIQYGVQIAEGLAAAHEKGIIHRDLKPENLFITRDGRAKILDFGLAKVAVAADVLAADPDLTSSATSAGMVMGTAGYMAPEQVRGEAVDARTDIFALGAVLFEMISGQRVFRRETAAETMTAVLREDAPEFSGTAVQIPPALDRIVRRCLEKDPAHRFQSARDLSFAMGVLSGGEASGSQRAAAVAAAGPRRSWLRMGLFGVALIAVGAAAWLLHGTGPAAARLEFAIPVGGETSNPMLSADGRFLAYVSPDDTTGAAMLFVQRIGTASATELAGTEGASYPFFSPDDQWIAFFANGKLQKIPAGGGPAQMLALVSFPRGGSWGSRNVIIYSPDPAGPLWRVNADGSHGGNLTGKIFDSSVDSHRWPLFLPDGNHFVFLGAKFGSGDVAAVSSIVFSSLDGSEKKIVARAKSNAGYGAGHLFYVDNKESLVAAPFDSSSGTIRGDSQVIADVVGFQPSVYAGAFTVALNGTLVYSAQTNYTSSQLTWFDRGGKPQGTVGAPALQANPALSPDGSRVALDITDLKANNLDVWIEATQGGTNTRFTFDPAEETDPVWSRDGKTIAYRSLAGENTATGIDVKDAAGLTAARSIIRIGLPGTASTMVTNIGADIVPNSWSADDQQLLCSLQNFSGGSRGSELVVAPASGGVGVPLLKDNASETNGQISPDGKWVAYASNESGAWEIYVTTFPGAAGKWQVSRGGGSEPRWRGDGKEMFYLSPTGMLMAVALDLGATFSSGPPAPLFQVRGRAPISSTDLFTYDVTRDGQRFLVNEYLRPQTIAPLVIVQNATSDPPK
ncbi:MAG TPA: protein kinase [Acidobacteriaceae bacterium]|jgi:Tol biopolymer transport system component|nr:protein kinase [Acidobacteriaceae bacterium]